MAADGFAKIFGPDFPDAVGAGALLVVVGAGTAPV
jgi:hypothetical protein